MTTRRSAVAAAAALGLVVAVAPTAAADTPTGVDLQPDVTHQVIEGFGYSSAFQRATLLYDLSEPQRSEALDLLLGEDGASPDIIRLGIGGQSVDTYDVMLSIQPEDPGGPDAEPQYQWDGWDNGQVWFAREAVERGVEQFYGNAWTAPGYMKTNDSPIDGGTLCGLAGTDCASGDWTQAYADYLVAWADLYGQEGVEIDGLAFGNEMDYTTSYESMRMTPAQAAEFTGVLGPVAQEAGYGVVCCESFGWNQGKTYTAALEADPEAASYIDAYSAHSYASRSDTPVATDKPVWMSEWASSSVAAGWNESWDGGSGVVTDGLLMADHMQDSLVGADVNAYLWWLGVSQGASASLLQADVANDTYRVSGRYYAFSAFSRFIDPGAVRFEAATEIEGLTVSAYTNPDGQQVVQLLNMGFDDVSTEIDLAQQPQAYLTDNDHDLELSSDVAVTGGGTTALELPARSLVTLVADPEDGTENPSAGIPVTATVEEAGEGQLALTVADVGDGVELTGGEDVGDRLRFTGDLPTVTVTDTRTLEQAGSGGGWAATGQSSPFSGPVELAAGHLGWTPRLLDPDDGASPGGAVATVLNGGRGLAEPATLANAGPESRTGSTELTAELALEVPVDTPAGDYSGTLTLSLFPVD